MSRYQPRIPQAQPWEYINLSEIGGYSTDGLEGIWCVIKGETIRKAKKALVKGEAKWELGPEYEFAYCSHCGHMQFANWDTHSEAAEKIGSFYKEYKYCPNCGAKIKGKENGNDGLYGD